MRASIRSDLLPFLGRLFPGLPIVPLLMGQQNRRTIELLARSPMDSRRGVRCSSPAQTCHFSRGSRGRLDGVRLHRLSPERLSTS